jgi:hypothetical protein
MLRIGPRARNLLLGTATPIQTEVHELWDLLHILDTGADFVPGREWFSRWADCEKSPPVAKGDATPNDEKDAWEWLRNPLPPAGEDALFATLRLQLGLAEQSFFTDRGFGSMGFLGQQAIGEALAPRFLQGHSPVVRHTVLRRRQTLEEAGLLERIGVNSHPGPDAPATPSLPPSAISSPNTAPKAKPGWNTGCIIFSQYYDTAYSLGAALAKSLPGEPVAAYAGTGKSGLFRDDDFASVEREDIKNAVKKREIRLVVATDAACEGLNLQTLGTLINVDLPWNPARLEQGLGRIKRFGQARRTVDMPSLAYHDTQDEKVYQALPRRMEDRYNIFGGLPDTIEDDWIENVEKLDDMMDEYMHLRQQARDVFEMRYQETIDPDKDRWELCSRVLSRRDIAIAA